MIDWTPEGRKGFAIAAGVARQPWAWPGGYPRFAVLADGEALCPACCKSQRRHVGSANRGDGWVVVAADVNWEDPDLFCGHCGERIPSAYAEAGDEREGVAD